MNILQSGNIDQNYIFVSKKKMQDVGRLEWDYNTLILTFLLSFSARPQGLHVIMKIMDNKKCYQNYDTAYFILYFKCPT